MTIEPSILEYPLINLTVRIMHNTWILMEARVNARMISLVSLLRVRYEMHPAASMPCSMLICISFVATASFWLCCILKKGKGYQSKRELETTSLSAIETVSLRLTSELLLKIWTIDRRTRIILRCGKEEGDFADKGRFSGSVF